jgi:3-methylcrotonyl-CoA carboxylase alpha subunit
VMAPIPGRIASVLVAPGERVARGQVLLVLEAMKMEMSLTASMDGVVASLRCAAGDMVQEGVDLVTFEQEDAA